MAFNRVIQRLEAFTDIVEFERLCCDILARNGYRGIEPQGIGRVDGGKDAVLARDKESAVVFHFSLRRDWQNKLEEDLAKVRDRALLPRGGTFVFVSNRAIPPLSRDKLKAEVKSIYNWNLDVWEQERLRADFESVSLDLANRYLHVDEDTPMTDTVARHLSDIKRLILLPLTEDFEIFDAILHLGGPLVTAHCRGVSIASPLTSAPPEVRYEEVIEPYELMETTDVLYQDAIKNHFHEELKARIDVYDAYKTLIVPGCTALVEELAQQFRKLIDLPTAPENVGEGFINAKSIGALLVNKRLGVYEGHYTLTDTGQEVRTSVRAQYSCVARNSSESSSAILLTCSRLIP